MSVTDAVAAIDRAEEKIVDAEHALSAAREALDAEHALSAAREALDAELAAIGWTRLQRAFAPTATPLYVNAAFPSANEQQKRALA